MAAHLTPIAMTDMIARYHSALDQYLADPLVLVPLAILDFFCIHPFPDHGARHPAHHETEGLIAPTGKGRAP